MASSCVTLSKIWQKVKRKIAEVKGQEEVYINLNKLHNFSVCLCHPSLLDLVFTNFLYFSKFCKMYFQAAWTTRDEAVVDTPATSKYVDRQVSKSHCCQKILDRRRMKKGTFGSPFIPRNKFKTLF